MWKNTRGLNTSRMHCISLLLRRENADYPSRSGTTISSIFPVLGCGWNNNGVSRTDNIITISQLKCKSNNPPFYKNEML
jgi:hypothetical protein